MKNKSIITFLSLCLGLSMITTSCNDMLTSDSNRHSYEVAGDTLYSYWGILNSLQNLGERYVILGECRGELIDGSQFTTDSVNAILSFGLNGDTENIRDGANRYLKVSDYYHVINSCNAYLAKVDTLMEKADGERYMLREYAQVEAIRAWTYMQLVINYGDVPFYLDPMLSTNDITSFDSSNPANRVNASNLWQKLEQKLIRAYQIEEQWGFPQYFDYGYTSSVCHSTKSMFPTSLVLADLYLMGNQYTAAASYYYEFLDGEYGGALPSGYYSHAYLPQGGHNIIVTNNGYPWNEKGATNKTSESITAIPSSINSLWGIVQRGVNDLYGFEATIRQTTGNDSVARASITLSQNWERQLGPSKGYDDLRLAQKFEAYRVSSFAQIDTPNEFELVVLDSIGDARGIAAERGNGYISRYNSGDYYINDLRTERYIMKQNPSGNYSTVFPMVYRKSMVWLRFAEALNRAGFPGYAFAILKNGLTRNSNWLPREKESFLVKNYRVRYEYKGTVIDENGEEKDVSITLPSNWETNDSCIVHTLEYSLASLSDSQKDTLSVQDTLRFIECIKAHDITGHLATVDDTLSYIVMEVENYSNFLSTNTPIVCDYISRAEWEAAQGLIFMDFNNSQFNGQKTLPIGWVEHFPLEKGDWLATAQYPTSTAGDNEYVVRGIHQKGCGLLKYNEKNSVYNFVDQVNLKLKAAGKQTLSKAEMYEYLETHRTDGDVVEAIEELILDEAALELAFEGNRFFDLMRVANRRGGNAGKFMSEKIASRGENTEWANNLTDVKNWYLPLPDYSNRQP